MLSLPPKDIFESPDILKALISARASLAELKGIVPGFPNREILLSNLTLQEAKDSSAIENIITTQDSLYKYQIQADARSPADREIHNYARALRHGYKYIESSKGISLNAMLQIQEIIEPKRPGFRKIPGTVLKNQATGQTVYTPPSPENIPAMMNQLEKFINEAPGGTDPLIRMAVIHHWFETVHPFYDGNGRAGRIINVLYLILKGLLDSPVLYLSRYIIQNKGAYYKLLQKVREDEAAWRDWILYMAEAVDLMSRQTAKLVKNMSQLLRGHKNLIRERHKFYSQDLINHIFSYPYTKIALLAEELNISRPTATRYLDDLAGSGILKKRRLGRESYYINSGLFALLKDS